MNGYNEEYANRYRVLIRSFQKRSTQKGDKNVETGYNQKNEQKIWKKSGIIGGLLTAVLSVLLYMPMNYWYILSLPESSNRVGMLTLTNHLPHIVAVLLMIIAGVCYFLLAMRVAQQTGKASDGRSAAIIAGLVAGSVCTVILGLLMIVEYRAGEPYSHPDVIAGLSQFLFVVYSILLIGIYGLG